MVTYLLNIQENNMQFKVGDKVVKKDGSKFLYGYDILTIKSVSRKEDQTRFHFEETGYYKLPEELLLHTYPNPPHKHRDLIIEWASGADIQVWADNDWFDVTLPSWHEIRKYRVKPQKSKRDNEIENIQKQMDELKERLEKLKG